VVQHTDLLNQSSIGMKVMGEYLIHQGEYQRAIAALTKAIALGPADLETEFLQGQSYLVSGQYDLAAEIFNRLVGRRPDHLGYYALLGNAYRRAGRLMESVRVLESAGKLDPDDIAVLLNLGHTYFDLGWLQKAEQLLLHARELNPDLVEIDINLGVVYWLMGKTKTARTLFDRAGRSPRSAQAAFNNEANILFQAKDTRKAIELYRRADKAGKRNETVLFNLGMAYLNIGKLKEANESFEELLRLSPDRLDVLTMQAGINQNRGDTAAAVLYYRRILDQSPYHEGALRGLVSVLNNQAKFQESIDVIERYLADFPNAREIRVIQAETYRQMGWGEVALMKYEYMTRDFPAYAEGYAGYARTLYSLVVAGKKDDFDNVIFQIKNAAVRAPQSPEPDYYAGLIYADYKGFPDLALQQFNLALGKAADPEMKKQILKAIARVKHQ
jgi:tetratricopeptide (TPR) repeat protein